MGRLKKGGKIGPTFESIIYNKNAVLYIKRVGLCIIEILYNERNRTAVAGVAGMNLYSKYGFVPQG